LTTDWGGSVRREVLEVPLVLHSKGTQESATTVQIPETEFSNRKANHGQKEAREGIALGAEICNVCHAASIIATQVLSS
jgi:cytochrome c5